MEEIGLRCDLNTFVNLSYEFPDLCRTKLVKQVCMIGAQECPTTNKPSRSTKTTQDTNIHSLSSRDDEKRVKVKRERADGVEMKRKEC